MAGYWISDPSKMQLVLPKKVADQLWQDVLASAVQSAITTSIEKDKSLPADGDVVEGAPAQLGYNRAWIYFRDRKTLLKARRLVEQEYKFEAKSPFDKFEGKIRLVTTARVCAWTILIITLGAACGSIFCTFLAWVSRRRYEIALLKAQGSGNMWVAGTYILQSAVAGLLAGVSGILISQRFICPFLSTWITRVFELKEAVLLVMPPQVQFLMIGAAFFVAVLAAFIPACIAARQDPWDVLREAS
ncbi:MAG: ABC transporter permease [Spartobacteria bacterium]|nr:ABC transporter permease [Spartobacteria bacterium]